MFERSPNLDMPFIQPSQAQKHVTHNEALEYLDALVGLSVKAFDAVDPPVGAAEGERYALGVGASGDWAGQDGMLAVWANGGWLYLAPQEGWRAFGEAEQALRIYRGGQWAGLSFDQLGLGATPDAVNRLSVAAEATLLSHNGAGHQLKLNKASAGETASLLFQSNWTGHAEMGLAGENDWSIKVSPDGSNWTTALKVAAATGHLSGSAVQADALDATEGRLLTVGGFGLGSGAAPEVTDLDVAVSGGIVSVDADTAANVPTGMSGRHAVLVAKSEAGGGFQMLCEQKSDGALYLRRLDGGVWGAWQRLWDSGSLVGTVSESGGVPTGAVIEQGSNTNGAFTKWADGTMICAQALDLSFDAVHRLAADWNYPAVFAMPPVVTATLDGDDLASNATPVASEVGAVGMEAVGASSARAALHRISGLTDFAAADSARVYLSAQGRWF
ncbi:DUF2793 domain-containing protein [Shimia sp. R10_1]|uniref:DUF2793 domain-containing protein n=1 Tax=Shimia sp. R10_1 TaxID=2821095 RepID=UPI001ADB1CBB|nr:DUF2793 domain-containing protein [Shimia sp. R10_1]MBO9473794.1 DUF2793 domain-containing protein [Shimia sp. R10_1]